MSPFDWWYEAIPRLLNEEVGGGLIDVRFYVSNKVEGQKGSIAFTTLRSAKLLLGTMLRISLSCLFTNPS